MVTNDLVSIIKKFHGDDESQLNVIFSEEQRLLVEAPAGYGKTATMVSRLSLLWAREKIPNPKKILGLTFSVNAALKIKKDISSILPMLVGETCNPTVIREKITVTNYHGLCKSILGKYGYKMTTFLKRKIESFDVTDDIKLQKNIEYNKFLLPEDSLVIDFVCKRIAEGSSLTIDDMEKYCDVFYRDFLPHGIISHNAIIIFAILLLWKNEEIRKFYQSYFSAIIVDEFQDTNGISWALLRLLISENTQLLFLGDPLQRIYGFIGAYPQIMENAKKRYNMKQMNLTRNHRFANNANMIRFNDIIRHHFANSFDAEYSQEEAHIPCIFGSTQEDEAELVVKKVKELLAKDECKVAILFRTRNAHNIYPFENALNTCGVDYFYGLTLDGDKVCTDFYKKCLELFKSKFEELGCVTIRKFEDFIDNICRIYADSGENKDVKALIQLLNAFKKKMVEDYPDMSSQQRYSYILSVLEQEQLKQSMEYVDSKIVLTTIHAAKGLEWDYVFVCDLEKSLFPSYRGVCSSCPSINGKSPCVAGSVRHNQMMDELSVFYVAVTRAKKQVFLTYSTSCYNLNGTSHSSELSCLGKMQGLHLYCAN